MSATADAADPARCADLTDAGSPIYIAATMVNRNGHVRYVLVHRGWWGYAQPGYDPDATAATHERLGLLPEYWRRRVAAV